MSGCGSDLGCSLGGRTKNMERAHAIIQHINKKLEGFFAACLAWTGLLFTEDIFSIKSTGVGHKIHDCLTSTPRLSFTLSFL